MKRIHILNYESYALDYLEGQLTPEDQQAFEAFLEQHPEVAADLEGLDEFQLTPPAIVYPNTSGLHRRAGIPRAWAMAAGWALLVTLSGIWWLQMPTQQKASAVVSTEESHPTSITLERVSVSQTPATESLSADVQPALRAEQGIHTLPVPEPSFESASEEKVDRNIETVASLPVHQARLLQAEVTVITTGAENDNRNWNPHRSSPGLLNPDKIAALDPFARMLSENQKEWVSNWRPLESIKEEINRDRWAEALTPEFLYSPKSAK